MTEPEEPQVTEVPEPDQDPHEPVPDEAEEDEEADVDTDDAINAEDEAEQEAPVATQEISERALRNIANSFKTYTASVSRNMGDHAPELVPCPLCPEMHPGFLNIGDAGRVPDFVKEPVLQFLGIAREQSYEPDPETQECATCKGKGKTSTGSHVPGKETRACPRCNGSGATGLSVTLASVPANGHDAEAFTLATDDDKGLSDNDNWGQPRLLPDGRENPNWGKMPQYWVRVEPWGDTRNLPAGV